MKYISVLLLLGIIFLSSCSSHRAISKKTQTHEYEMVTVQPDWEYKGQKKTSWITPTLGLAAGLYYGSKNDLTYDGKVYTGNTSTAIWGGIGALGGILIHNWFFKSKK